MPPKTQTDLSDEFSAPKSGQGQPITASDQSPSKVTRKAKGSPFKGIDKPPSPPRKPIFIHKLKTFTDTQGDFVAYIRSLDKYAVEGEVMRTAIATDILPKVMFSQELVSNTNLM